MLDPNDSPRHPGADYARCCWPHCAQPSFTGRDLPLCQGHALWTWSTIDRDMAADRQREACDKAAAQEREARADREAMRTTGRIYFLRIGDLIKIGYTVDLDQRLHGYPPGAEVLAVRFGTMREEQQLHARFAVHRAHRREWYQPAPSIIDHIAEVVAEYGHPRNYHHLSEFSRVERRPQPVRVRARSRRR